MDFKLAFVLVFAATVASSSNPPSRLDLFRFFMGFGPEPQPQVQKISFNPEAGLRFREQYQKKYGPRGQLLIERFGQGLAKEGPPLVDVDQLLDVPHKNKTKHYRTYDFNPKKPKNKKEMTIEVELSTTTSPVKVTRP